MTRSQLADGRLIEVLDNQVAADVALVLHHGTPSDATLWLQWLNACAQRGVRALAASRPGYGESERRRGRRVVDVNDDTVRLLAERGVRKFVALGWSGGGPHALANGCDVHCRGVITLAGVAAYGAADLDFLAGMGPENHEEFGAAVAGEAALQTWLAEHAEGLRHITGPHLRDAFGGLVGAVDRAVLEGQFADDLASTMRHALAHGFDGWVDDDLAFVRPWGFGFDAIQCPVELWQGDQDLMVPHAHSYWLEKQIPAARLHFAAGHGHISLGEHYREAILDQVEALLAA